MGKVKNLVTEAHEFAQEHYNIHRDEYYKLVFGYGWRYYFQLQEAVNHWEQIQTEIDSYSNNTPM